VPGGFTAGGTGRTDHVPPALEAVYPPWRKKEKVKRKKTTPMRLNEALWGSKISANEE